MHKALSVTFSVVLAVGSAGCFGSNDGSARDGGPPTDGGPTFDAVFDAEHPQDGAHQDGPSGDGGSDSQGDVAAPSASLTLATTSGSSGADFGTVVVGSSSAPLTLVLSNGGAAASGTLDASLGGSGKASFAIDSDGCTGKALAAGKTCSITVHFQPQTAGTLAGSLQVADSNGGQAVSTLVGDGATPGALTISPTSQDFKTVTTGAKSPAVSFTVTNTGMTATKAISTSVTGTEAADFVIDGTSDTCAGKTLDSKATCNLSVVFGPSTAGARSASLVATDGVSTTTAALTGTAVGPAAFTITPAAFDFKTVVQGTSSAPQKFTVTNSGGVPSDTPLITSSSSDFPTSASTCTAPLDPAATCTFDVTFDPATTTSESATLTATGAATQTGSATVTGTGQVPPTPATLVVTPGTGFTGDFAVIALGKSSTQPMVLSNTGDLPTSATPKIVSAGADFTIGAGSPSCTGVLAGGASCGFTVTFAPSVASAESSLLTASDPASTSGTYTVKGTGGQPTLTVSPPAAWTGFTNVEVGTSQSATFTVTNTGPVATNSAPSVTSSNGDFAPTTGPHPCSTALAPNGTCDFVVTFSPASTTGEQSTLSATVIPGTSVPYVASGNGAVPTLQVAAQTTTDFSYVTVGQSMSLSFVVTNTGSVPSGPPTLSSSTGDFTTTAGTCTGQLAQGGGNCAMTVVFKPTSSASQESSLITATPTVNGNAVGNAGTITVTGQGGVGSLSGLSSWTSATLVQGTTNHVSYTVTNVGHGSTGVLGVTSFPSTSPFSLATNTCNAALLPQATCSLVVVFAPTSTNSTPGTTSSLGFTVSDGGTAFESATVSGFVVSAGAYVVISPSPASWGTVAAGSTGNILNVTATNYGAAQATLFELELLNTAGYRIGSTGSTCNTTLAAYNTSTNVGASCADGLSLTAAGPTTSLPASAAIQAVNANLAAQGPADPLQASW